MREGWLIPDQTPAKFVAGIMSVEQLPRKNGIHMARKASPPPFRDRVKDFRRVDASELVPNPKNWRIHNDAQRAAYRGLVAELGFAGAELVRELPDGRLMLIDGHMRAEEHGGEALPVLVTDLTEEEADVLLASFDPLAAMAGANQQKLDE